MVLAGPSGRYVMFGIHLQETHLDKSIPTSEILDPERYEIVRKDRTCKKGHEGGGVINAVRKDTVCSGEDTLDTDCEIAWTARLAVM
jgi:hypothetical protein